MKTLRQILNTEVYDPKPGDEKKFKDKHVTVKQKLMKTAEDDALYQATNVKTINRDSHHGYNPGKDEEVYEGLKASDPTSKWINDFVHSDNPKFAGKSKKERINMALGAKYATEEATFSDEDLELMESQGAEALYNTHYKDAVDIAKQIVSGLKKHKESAKKTGMHYGHVGDLVHAKRYLEDMRDLLHRQGEYSPSNIVHAPMREDVVSVVDVIEGRIQKSIAFTTKDAATLRKEILDRGHTIVRTTEQKDKKGNTTGVVFHHKEKINEGTDNYPKGFSKSNPDHVEWHAQYQKLQAHAANREAEYEAALKKHPATGRHRPAVLAAHQRHVSALANLSKHYKDRPLDLG